MAHWKIEMQKKHIYSLFTIPLAHIMFALVCVEIKDDPTLAISI